MKAIKILFILITSITLFSCQETISVFIDETPPDVPQNIATETGDNLVIIYWDKVYNSDLEGYAVYYSDSYNGEYKLLGTTSETSYIDYGAANGETYYYAIASYDMSGNESDLSYDVAYDTPRPEGFNQQVFDYKYYPELAGYDFSKYATKIYNSLETDFFFENDDGTFYLNVWSDTDIQNMGRTTDIYSISYAPLEGWVELLPGDNVKYLHAMKGYTYVIWTWDNHFAKIRISNIAPDYIEFDWAYQTAEGNVELKTNRIIENRVLPQKVVVKRKQQ